MASMEVLPECTGAFNDIRLQVGLMERDIANNRALIEKLTEGIEKIQEMNMNLVKMLALHDQKHEIHEKIEEGLDEDVKELHSRISTESRITQEKIDSMESALFKRLESIHKELLAHIVMRTSPTSSSTPPVKDDAEVSKTLTELNRWKYILMGIIFALGWVLAKINWSVASKLFGE